MQLLFLVPWTPSSDVLYIDKHSRAHVLFFFLSVFICLSGLLFFSNFYFFSLLTAVLIEKEYKLLHYKIYFIFSHRNLKNTNYKNKWMLKSKFHIVLHQWGRMCIWAQIPTRLWAQNISEHREKFRWMIIWLPHDLLVPVPPHLWFRDWSLDQVPKISSDCLQSIIKKVLFYFHLPSRPSQGCHLVDISISWKKKNDIFSDLLGKSENFKAVRRHHGADVKDLGSGVKNF